MPRTILATVVWVTIATAGPSVMAQTASTSQPPTSDSQEVTGASQERLSENHLKATGNVELLLDRDTKLFADEVEIFRDQDRAIATGNVVFVQGRNRIAAERAEFNTKTRMGTFYSASGIANVQPPRRAPTPGAFLPPAGGSQDTDVYFFGEIVEKIGPKKYKITNGGFSTCVQPTPRWDLHADTLVLNVDDYTLLRNAIFNVKGVPLLYLPILYYPTKEDGRATGFLIPTYGISSLRGQAIHNGFFWAINRSQDATLMHDWYSKAGQGYGAEYRYNYGGGSDGHLAAHLLDQRGTSATAGAITLPQTRAFELRGAANQPLPGRLHARGRADYFSSVAVMQTYNTNVYDASRNQRSFGVNMTGAWRTFSLNSTYDRSEYFTGSATSEVVGSSPRISLARNERPLFGSPLYFSANTEFVHLDRDTRRDGESLNNRGLGRFDVIPQVRYPFKKWQWFTVNSSVAWRDTYYTRSLVPGATPQDQPTLVDDDVNRRYYTMQAQAVGPVFNKIWATPNSAYAERLKHTIEPFLNVERTSAIDNRSRIVPLDGVDQVFGNNTRFTYGINNRIYAKRRTGQRVSAAQEILSVEILQSYYTEAQASQVDTQFNTSFSGAPSSNFSAIAMSVRASPSQSVNATVRAELDSSHYELRTINANTNLNLSGYLQANVGWSKRFFVPIPGFNDPQFLDHYLNVAANVHTRDNRVGVNYSFNYDVLRTSFLQQRLSGYYSAQCCGLALEYQTYSFGGPGGPSDRRFFLSFSLAGLGAFSPFNGAMSGTPR